MYGHTLTWTPGNVLIQFLSRLSPDLGMSGKTGVKKTYGGGNLSGPKKCSK